MLTTYRVECENAEVPTEPLTLTFTFLASSDITALHLARSLFTEWVLMTCLAFDDDGRYSVDLINATMPEDSLTHFPRFYGPDEDFIWTVKITKE